MIDLFGMEIPDVPIKAPKWPFGGGKRFSNPCVKVFGPGPPDTICKSCALLVCKEYGKRYYKCEKRGLSASASTDHRLGWPACALYQKRTEP